MKKDCDWQRCRLRDILEVKHGFAFAGEHFRHDGKLVLLTPGNFKEEGGFKKKDGKEKYYVGPVPEGYLLKEKDLLVAMTEQAEGLLGSAAWIPESHKYLHNQRLGLVSAIDPNTISIPYLYYLLNSKMVRRQIRSTASGTKVRHTSPSRIGEVNVSLPPLSLQRRIASLLSTYDALIQNNMRRISILEEIGKRIFEECFARFRRDGIPDGQLPKGWTKEPLWQAAHLTMGQSPKSQFYNEEGIGLPFHQGVTDFGPHFPQDCLYCTVADRTADDGDILFSVRAPVGRINVATKKIVIGRGLSAIRSKRGHQAFLLCQLRHKFSTEDLIGGGTIFKAVTKHDMETIELVRPPDALVARFQSAAVPIWGQLRTLTDSCRNLSAQLGLLHDRLVSGQIDIDEVTPSREIAAE